MIAVGVLFRLAGELDHRQLVFILQQQQFIDPFAQGGGLFIRSLVLFGQFRQPGTGLFQLDLGFGQRPFQAFLLFLPFFQQPAGLKVVLLEILQLLGQPGGFLVKVFQIILSHRFPAEQSAVLLFQIFLFLAAILRPGQAALHLFIALIDFGFQIPAVLLEILVLHLAGQNPVILFLQLLRGLIQAEIPEGHLQLALFLTEL